MKKKQCKADSLLWKILTEAIGCHAVDVMEVCSFVFAFNAVRSGIGMAEFVELAKESYERCAPFKKKRS